MYLSVKKLDKLSLKYLHNYYLMLVKFAKYLNKSASEVNITDVRIADINWTEGCLKIVGKCNEEWFVYFTVKCRILLRKYLDSRKNCNEYLFVSKNKPYTKLGRRTLEREISKIAENAKINKSIFPHIIRHTMATVSLNSGMPVTTVQRLL